MTVELPSGLPELRLRLSGAIGAYAATYNGDSKACQLLRDCERIIASIPDMVEEIGSKARIIEALDKENTRLCEQIGDSQTLLDAAIAGLADNERLRARNAELRESLEHMWLIAGNGNLTPHEDAACEKARALLGIEIAP